MSPLRSVGDVGAGDEELDEAARRAETPRRHARCSPESMKVPSEIYPASAATSPTVGANCRRGEQQMPRGRLKFGGRWTLEDPGRDYALKSTHEKTNTHGFTQVRGSREEIKPLLLLV